MLSHPKLSVDLLCRRVPLPQRLEPIIPAAAAKYKWEKLVDSSLLSQASSGFFPKKRKKSQSCALLAQGCDDYF